jgi:hypothetical protein
MIIGGTATEATAITVAITWMIGIKAITKAAKTIIALIMIGSSVGVA